MNRSGEKEQRTFSKNVVKRGRGMFFAQVVENAQEINFQKCPIYPMQYDIMVL